MIRTLRRWLAIVLYELLLWAGSIALSVAAAVVNRVGWLRRWLV